MLITRHTVAVTTDASGDFVASIQGCEGLFMQVVYAPDATNPLATGADLTITEDDTSLNLLTFSNIGTSAFKRAARQVTADAANGTEGPVLDYIAVSGDCTLTIAQGGDTLSGTFYLYFGI